jgi:gluconokinase
LTRVVALDVGSSSVRAVAYDERGEPEPGHARLEPRGTDADELVAACRAVLAHVGEGDVLAISCFWHSLLAVDSHDRPLTPVLTWWDLDAPPVGLDRDYHRRTGCFDHPSFWPAKIRRLQADGIAAARYLSFPDYLLLRLAGEVCTSVSTASGTGLFDPNRLDWDDRTLEAIGVERSQLAPVADAPAAGVWPALGDGACSNVGVGGTSRGRVVVTIGTSAALRAVYAAESAEPRPGLFLYRVDDGRFCEGGALSDGGNLHVWLVQTLRAFDERRLEARAPAGHGLVFLPFLGGERSLGWRAGRRGLVHGLSFATTPLDLAQAALEGVCYRLADVLDALGGVESVVATGGALLASPVWAQLLADVLGLPVEIAAVDESSARGAAIVALERLGLPVPPVPIGRVVRPRDGHHEIHLDARRVQRETMQWEEQA